MVPSIKERKENASKFSLCYEDICKIQNRMPLPSVKAHLKKNILDFSGDRITCEEWAPILHALSMDRSLHFVGVRSTHCAKTGNHVVLVTFTIKSGLNSGDACHH